MTIRRLAVASVAVTALAGLGGCASDSEPAGSGGTPPVTATSSAPADPAAELGAAAGKLADTSVQVDLTAVGGIAITGRVDAGSQQAEMTTDMGSAGKMVMRQLGTDLYVLTRGEIGTAVGAPAGKWMRIDMTKVPESSALNVKNNDPRSTAKMISASSEVEKTGGNSFAGKVDLTKSTTMNPTALKTLGAKAKSVPFTAKTDAEGRLTELTIDLDAIATGAGKMVAKYSGFGAPVEVATPPAAEVVEMPEKFRRAMGA